MIQEEDLEKEIGKIYILVDWHTDICRRSSKLLRRSVQLLCEAYAIRDGCRTNLCKFHTHPSPWKYLEPVV